MDKLEAVQINRQLREKYGVTLGGENRYRLVWANDLTEHRDKKYDDIMARAETNAVLVPKYSYLKERWVLEFRAEVPVYQGEIKDWDGYECFYAFQWPDGSYQEPSWFHCDFLCYMKENIDPLTPDEARKMDEEDKKESIASYRAELENEGKLRLEDSVGYTGKEFSEN